jgi:hypothetical protein
MFRRKMVPSSSRNIWSSGTLMVKVVYSFERQRTDYSLKRRHIRERRDQPQRHVNLKMDVGFHHFLRKSITGECRERSVEKKRIHFLPDPSFSPLKFTRYQSICWKYRLIICSKEIDNTLQTHIGVT